MIGKRAIRRVFDGNWTGCPHERVDSLQGVRFAAVAESTTARVHPKQRKRGSANALLRMAIAVIRRPRKSAHSELPYVLRGLPRSSSAFPANAHGAHTTGRSTGDGIRSRCRIEW